VARALEGVQEAREDRVFPAAAFRLHDELHARPVLKAFAHGAAEREPRSLGQVDLEAEAAGRAGGHNAVEDIVHAHGGAEGSEGSLAFAAGNLGLEQSFAGRDQVERMPWGRASARDEQGRQQEEGRAEEGRARRQTPIMEDGAFSRQTSEERPFFPRAIVAAA
jgi:hypothetical protein